ncbi:cell wall-binding repeat-containing protein [Yonghaparkia sp. Soil809]|uniref:cell wall-binding repeat-containing protein n=1 Tax=Yonghaparkia sp. Soil809 TaxID=1736417 RepID=UPI0006FC2DBC|nr:cell wall-binding repeat-containing protein [Yonghaparkia sp. Soil809]KRF30815.1 hypothetical protein ASG83_08080 [Yonghaparkia sp. Soil809]
MIVATLLLTAVAPATAALSLAPTAGDANSGSSMADAGQNLTAAATGVPSAGVHLAERDLILKETNALRAANGLPPFRVNEALDDIAQDWAEQQATTGAMSHRVGFASLYPSGWSRAAENVAMGYQPDSVVDAWAASTGHRANILSSSTDIGIGAARDARGRWFYTQNFGRYAVAPPTVPGAVHRIAGPDRYAVSARTSARTFAAGVPTVYVASGANFPDALSAAALAGAARGPLLLVSPTSVPAVVLAELRRLSPARIVVAGGPASVSDPVLAALRTVAPRVDRMSGADRYEVSRNLGIDAYGSSGAPTVFLATGSGFADALAAGPAAASVRAPVLLVRGSADVADAATLAFLRKVGARSIVIVGGPATVTQGIESSLASAGYAVQRIGGADRFEVAAGLASRYFPDASRAYVATGRGFADALSGGAAAGALGAPLLTSNQACLPASVRSAISARSPADIVLLGGHATLAPTVAGFYRC